MDECDESEDKLKNMKLRYKDGLARNVKVCHEGYTGMPYGGIFPYSPVIIQQN